MLPFVKSLELFPKHNGHGRGWSRALICSLVELCQVECQLETPTWLMQRGNVFKIWTSRWSKNASAESHFYFFVLFTELMCCDSIFSLPKRVADYSFTFLCKTLVFALLSFLTFEAKPRCPRNQYTDLKSALDQTLHGFISESFALDCWIFTPLVYKKLLDGLRCRSTKNFF